MGILEKTFFALSGFTDANERMVGRFFAKLNENKNLEEIRSELLHLLQKNIIAVNLWSEYKYRQYKYLKKPSRKNLYQNAVLIKEGFIKFIQDQEFSWEATASLLQKAGVDPHKLASRKDRLMYLAAIMHYLSPHSGRYDYRESSTFGAILQDPSKHKLLGDCNQIVTLYIYLYAQKYPISELQLRTLPGHVALHFEGIDIEATSAIFTKYNESYQALLPVEEIVSLNLLDVSDQYFKTHKVSAIATLESARVAYVLSSQRQVVSKNLAVAYNNATVEMVKENSFKKALNYAKASGDNGLVNMVGSNATLYYLNANQFNTALDFAYYSKERKNLEHIIFQNEGAYYFNKGDYHKAISAFEKIKDSSAIKNCYIALFNKEQSKLGSLKTEADIKNNSKTIYSMDSYAKKSGSSELMSYVDGLKKFL